VNSGLPIGTVVVGHRIEDLLGRGGMGFVYKAEHLDLGRRVALKVLAPELAHDDEFRTRFMQESRMAARLEHPSIIPIYEAGAGDGLLYISMRLINGPDLGTIIAREGRMDAGRAVHLIAQIGNALDSAHRQGFVHRDVKPSNILVAPPSGDETGEHAWLCDFGLVKHFGATTGQRLTRTGAFMGTVQYVAPEQIEGRTLDGRADVYALACVLYECLTGIVPFDRETDVATLWAHLNDPPPATRLVRPDLPGQLDAVIARAMAKRPDQRFATCGELVRAVRGVLAGPDAGPGAVAATRPAETAPAAAPGPGGYAPPSYGGPSSAPAPGYGFAAGYGTATPPQPQTRSGTWSGAHPPPPHGTPPAWPPPQPRSRRPLLLGAGALALVVVLAVALALRPGSERFTCAASVTPQPGNDLYSAAMDGVRQTETKFGIWEVDDLRSFVGESQVRWWYVKAHQERDTSAKGRWLLQADAAGKARVAAVAAYDSRGFASPDWHGFRGSETPRSYDDLPGEWAGPDFDFVKEVGLPADVRGCMAGT
jgi:hypothetical protein